MTTTGDLISASDYNTIRTKIVQVMGVGSGDRGYGQAVASTPVTSLVDRVTKAQWDALRFDIINARVHQIGEAPVMTIVSKTDPIRYGVNQPNYQYDTLATSADTDRKLVANGQFILASATNQTYSSAWANSVACTVTATFSTVDQARYFFNSGGKIRFTSSRTGGTSSQQNDFWTGLLNAVGAQDFGISSAVGFYGLTTSYQTLYSSLHTYSSIYSSNSYTVQVKCDATGNARIVTFLITWTDSYTDPGFPPPGDLVDGTLTLTVDEVRAYGTLLPDNIPGSFAVTRPAYSISSISGS